MQNLDGYASFFAEAQAKQRIHKQTRQRGESVSHGVTDVNFYRLRKARAVETSRPLLTTIEEQARITSNQEWLLAQEDVQGCDEDQSNEINLIETTKKGGWVGHLGCIIEESIVVSKP